MLEVERNKLMSRKSKYLSIGITKDGTSVGIIPIPWKSMAHSYNMRIPDVYISPDDLNNSIIWEKIKSFKVIGLYIWTPLEKYDFINRLHALQDIFIMDAKCLNELDFLEENRECMMLMLHGAELDTLDKIVAANNRKDNLFCGLNCVALCNCEVKDLTVFEKEEHYFSEFLLWLPKGKNKKRWKVVRAGIKEIYLYDDVRD